jgi:hypothetical protein
MSSLVGVTSKLPAVDPDGLRFCHAPEKLNGSNGLGWAEDGDLYSLGSACA